MNWDLVVIFLFILAMSWMRLRSRQASAGGLSPGDQTALSGAMDVARRLEQRVETLERVLDEDAPGWRARVRA